MSDREWKKMIPSSRLFILRQVSYICNRAKGWEVKAEDERFTVVGSVWEGHFTLVFFRVRSKCTYYPVRAARAAPCSTFSRCSTCGTDCIIIWLVEQAENYRISSPRPTNHIICFSAVSLVFFKIMSYCFQNAREQVPEIAMGLKILRF